MNSTITVKAENVLKSRDFEREESQETRARSQDIQSELALVLDSWLLILDSNISL